MSAIPVNEMLLQELNQLTGIKMLTSDFLEIFSSSSHFREGRGKWPGYPLLRTPMKVWK